jgi:excisionase family DNA binding protein
MLENRSADEASHRFLGAGLVQLEHREGLSVAPPNASRTATAPNQLLSAVEAAEQLGICPHSVYNLCETGKLRFVRVRNAIRIAQADLDAFRSTREALGLGPTPSGAARRRKRA